MTISLMPLALSQRSVVGSIVLDAGEAEFAGGPMDRIFDALAKSASPWALHPFGVMNGSEVVGFFVLRECPVLPPWASADAITLHNLRISRSMQGHGFGTATLVLARQWIAAERPDIRCLMLTVNVDNPAARALYLRSGFLPTGQILAGRLGPECVLTWPFEKRTQHLQRRPPRRRAKPC